MIEFRVFGPPGTGKTTYLCRQAELALKSLSRNGEFPQTILFSSLTRAAAAELKSRDISVPDEQIGTLHSHALRALGNPKLCVDSKGLAGWNATCKAEHRIALAGSDDDEVWERQSDSMGKRLLDEYHNFRSRLIDRELWSAPVLAFAAEYETWKRVSGVVDFSDAIHDAWASDTTAPGDPAIIIVDEAQDHDRAELRLVRMWGEKADKLVICGDPDQNLYEWRGSEPEAFSETPIPPEHRIVLSKSWRVPRAVHKVAARMIERVKKREKIEYHPRDADGAVIYLENSFAVRQVEYLVEHASRYSRGGKSVMFLASCAYIVRPVMKELRQRGIPYWNPYAKDRKDGAQFNPLHPRHGDGAVKRVLAYLRPVEKIFGTDARLWTPKEMLLWLDVLDGRKWLKMGSKTDLGKLAKQQQGPLTLNEIKALFRDNTPPDEVLDGDPLFLLRHVTAARKPAIEYVLTILRKSGHEALMSDPRVVCGTIHSVKGGEADVVYLSPELSPMGYDTLESINRRDRVFRQFYVGMTRARETLVLCEPNTGRSINW